MILWEEVERESFFLMVSESGGMRIWWAEGLESEVQIGRKELIREKKREKKFKVMNQLKDNRPGEKAWKGKGRKEAAPSKEEKKLRTNHNG